MREQDGGYSGCDGLLELTVLGEKGLCNVCDGLLGLNV